jgi:hypothetical protein
MDRRLLLIAVAGIAVIGCGSAANRNRNARIVGAIYYQGGPPAPNVLHKPRAEPGNVRVLNRSGGVEAQTVVREGQHYILQLAPGEYRVEARSGDAYCRPTAVSAQSQQTAMASVYCNVK